MDRTLKYSLVVNELTFSDGNSSSLLSFIPLVKTGVAEDGLVGGRAWRKLSYENGDLRSKSRDRQRKGDVMWE